MAYALINGTGFVNEMTMLEKLILMTACLGHDLDHPGYNNAYQVNGNDVCLIPVAKTDLAIIYNDVAPLENHHSAMLFAILNLDSCNLLKTLDQPSIAAVRKGMIRCILATDMAKHGEHLSTFVKLAPSFSFQDAEHRAQLLSIIIKCADISTEVRPPNVAGINSFNNLNDRYMGKSSTRRILFSIRS
jgi:high affinity cGMP-specific 3',5'-cyclic phosphodiesterase 9